MSFSKADTVRILMNLDAMGASHIPNARRAWAHLFIAAALLQKCLPNPEKLTKEQFLELAGLVYDAIESSVYEKIKAQG